MVRFRYPCAVALAVLTAACSAAAPQGVQAKPMSLEQLASGTGCELRPQQGAAELKQGSCETAQGKYVLVSFSTDEAAKSWLTEAKPWGGLYLEGPRWVIVGTEPQLKTFQQKVGGTIVAGEDHASGGSGHGH
ncbi:hypothetical protein [Actinocorallia longicatena]|uniref:Lipoprotein n=1 Tax=Actinocorallia longicatena TaxID=111803 RepID=A0ABP6QJQ8_9ACTN